MGRQRQRNKAQMKEQNSTEKELNEMEASNQIQNSK